MAVRGDLADEGVALSDDVRMGDADDEGDLFDGASAVTDEEASAPGDTALFDDPLFESGPPGLGGDDFAAGFETPPLVVGADEPLGGVPSGGAAGSSGDVPAGPPPLPAPATPPPPRPAAAKERQAPMAVVFVPGGKLTYYYSEKNAFCTAECNNPTHGRCVKTRTMREPARASAKSKGQGRPVGYLAAWLAKGIDLGSKALHWSDEQQPSFAERAAARAQVADDGSADSALLLAGEVPPQDGEDEPKLFA